MLVLVTGKPGNGKTLYTVSEIAKEFSNRRIFYWGIEGLNQLNWEPLESPEKWYEKPDGCVFIIDEAWKIFPVRSATGKVPKHCEAVSEHRHHGHDLVLITQDPKDIDAYVRRRVGRHVHIKRSRTGGERAIVRTLTDDVMEPDKSGWKNADKKQWMFPKASYAIYNSAQIHTHKKRIPRKLIFAVLLMLIAIFGYGYIGNAVYAKFDEPKVENEDNKGDTNPKTPGKNLLKKSFVNPQSIEQDLLTKEEWLIQFQPRVKGIPWSAPIYDDLVFEVREKPIPNCVSNKDRCWCYSQQGTRMDVSEYLCRNIVEFGYYNSNTTRVGGISNGIHTGLQ